MVNEMSTFVHARYIGGQSNVHVDQKRKIKTISLTIYLPHLVHVIFGQPHVINKKVCWTIFMLTRVADMFQLNVIKLPELFPQTLSIFKAPTSAEPSL